MTTRPAEPSPRQFTGWHMLALVCGFFGVVIAVNVTMAMLATGSWTGLVVKNSYVASQHFNEELLDARTQDALGWTSSMTYADGQLQFTMAARDGAGLSGARVDARLARPVGIEQDRIVTLTEDQPGTYRHDGSLAPGVWNVDVLAHTRTGTNYRQIFRLHVPEAR